MSTLLIMAPHAGLWPPWLRGIFPEIAAVGAGEVSCHALVVINDHSAAALGLLRRALELRAARPH
ncbi:MAG TPA: hypothetical protein VHE37_14290, partial [Nevskiaceae bacterium]|nr:hypothetical protein [Nevskiaceae bacterium]